MREVSGSRHAAPRDAVLARVVDVGEHSLFCGTHPQPLGPRLAAEAVRVVRGNLGARRKLTRERLREEESIEELLVTWHEAVEQQARPGAIPRLHNTDGDELLMTIDRYALEPGARDEVVRKLQALEGAVLAGDDGARDEAHEPGERVVDFLRDGNAMNAGMETTLLGAARVTAEAMRLETNSVKRADALRARVEAACGSLVRRRLRDHGDPQALLERQMKDPRRKARSEGPLAAGVPPEEARAILLAYKAKHDATWPDVALPALSGKTPREAAASPRHRAKLDVLLKEMENHEARLPEGERFDMTTLRTALGMDAAGSTPGSKRAAQAPSSSKTPA